MLQAIDLMYTYPDGPYALRGVSFCVSPGEIVGLIGENGAGKTTLIKCLLGLYQPEGGTVRVDGDCGERTRERLAYVSGEGASFALYTPLEAGEFLAEFYPRFELEKYRRLLRFFDLPDRPVRQMSTGQRAQAELAAGFCRGTGYILMDEPFANKDAFTRQDFLKLMAGGLSDEQAILLSTHLIQEAEPVISRALILHEGSIARDIDMEELREGGKTLLDVFAEVTGYDPKRAARLFSQ